MSNNLSDNQEEIFSRVLRAGRRTYFFDVRETKASDYYLTITESKKSDTFNPKKVTKMDKKIANNIDCATNNEAFLFLLAPILLPIKVLVPAVNPTPMAIIIK